MAELAKRSAAKMFNSPALSDVRIKQVYHGKVREYYAHKAVLCLESEYFLNAFTGNFKEATEGVMELHEDDPEHFEFLLKFIYTDKYDKDAIIKLAAEDKMKRIMVPIGIYAVADKYNIPKIYEPAAEDVKAVLLEAAGDNSDLLQSAIHAHYGNEVNVDGAMGRLITSVVLDKHRAFTDTADFERMMLSYPIFAADIALALRRENKLYVRRHECRTCSYISFVDAQPFRKHNVLQFLCASCGQRYMVSELGAS